MLKKILPVILITIMTFTGILPVSSFAAEAPELIAESAVLIDAKSGEVLYDKVKDYQEYPASTTKIMTALLALENLSLDDVVTVSYNASYTEGSRIYLFEGEHVTVEQLLYAMMLESANDAAIALAEAVAGDTDTFAEMMNARAKEIGAMNTNFVSPNGLPDDEHVTTAYDLALITMEAMKNEEFRKIVSTYSYDIPPTDKQSETRYLHNTNKLLSDNTNVNVDGVSRPYKYDGILGVKTGYTTVAQSCLVAAAERDGIEVIGVILKSDIDNQYPDMIKLLDYAFDRYEPVKIITAGDTVGTVRIAGGKSRYADATVAEDVYVMAEKLSNGESASTKGYSYQVTVNELMAPASKGDVAGSVTVFKDSKEAGTYDLILTEDVPQSALRSFFSNFGKTPASLLKILICLVICFMALYVAFIARVRRENRQARARREAIREERRRQYEMRVKSENLISEYDLQNSVDQVIEDVKKETKADDNNKSQ